MKPELIRIKIAEACGWKWFPAYNKRKNANFLVSPKGKAVTVWRDGGLGGGDNLPDYLNDLNAMHEAENQLTEEEWNRYASKLSVVVGDAMLGDYKSSYVVRATAAQRAEAFLRTLNLWTEDTAPA